MNNEQKKLNFLLIKGNDADFTDQEVVLLAHWDPDSIVDPYVAAMGEHFSGLGKKIILCSASVLTLESSTSWATAVVCRQSPGYDFTSWRAAFEAFPSLYKSQEVTLCNDSVFSPIGSYREIYKKMQTVKCDFWGLTASLETIPHIQSFHIVLKKTTLENLALKKFFSAVPLKNSRELAIAFERYFTLWLELHGLQPGVFVPFVKGVQINPTITYWKQLLEWGVPTLKRELLTKGGALAPMKGWYDAIISNGYEINLISDYFFRIGKDISQICCFGERAETFPPNIMLRQKSITLNNIKSPREISLATLVHCFYPEHLEILLNYIKYMPKWNHLYISTDSIPKKEIISKSLVKAGISLAEIRVFPNIGWDIAPFLVGFQDVIRTHDLILKIHVKASTSIEAYRANEWRTLLYASLLGDTTHINQIINLFCEDTELGMLAPPNWIWLPELSQRGNKQNLKWLFQKLDIPITSDNAIDFPAGSMFWARSAALKPLLGLGLTLGDFEPTDPSQRDGTLAHAIERIFFFSCAKADYHWGRVPPPPYTTLDANHYVSPQVRSIF